MKIKYTKISNKFDLPKKRLIIVGKGGSGKDHLKNLAASLGGKYCVSHTTRPARKGETDGVDYHFVTVDEFNKLVDEGIFLEYVTFNNWKYGTSKKEFENSNIFILTPKGISKLEKEVRAESFILYLDIDEETRRKRLAKRRDADDLDRRLKADKNDFDNFIDYDAKLTNPDFTLESLEKDIIYKNHEDQYNI